MARKHRISFTVSAVKDLEEILTWYTEQRVPDVGLHLVQELVSQVERLTDFPKSGRIVPEFAVTELREIIHPPFRIVYRLDRDRIRVVRVWRSERELLEP